MLGPLTAGRFACPVGYAVLSGGYNAGRVQAATAPLSTPHKGSVARHSPCVVIPTTVWHGFFGRTPVRSAVNRQAAPAPGLGS